MFRNIICVSLIGFGLLMNQVCFAAEFEEGVHYRTLTKPVVTADPDKIEVLELFWYGCPHCDQLDPAIKAWVGELPGNVNFVQMPVVFGQSWEMHARIFWVAKSLGILDEMHGPLFNAIHREGLRLQRLDDVVEFFERFGVAPDVVRRELVGFGTESQLRLTDSRVRTYGIRGVPAIVVNGRYVTGVSQAGGEYQLFKLMNELIEKSK